MPSIYQRISEIKQPRGGIISINDFIKTEFIDNKILFPLENLSAQLIGSIIDYLSRFLLTNSIEKSFVNLLLGGWLANEKDKAIKLSERIKGIDDKSIICACKLTGYDVARRYQGKERMKYINTNDINPDPNTIANIKIMANRTHDFFAKDKSNLVCGKVIGDLKFKYLRDQFGTSEIDIMTKDTIWDIKTSIYKPTSRNVLQLIIYAIFAKFSNDNDFKHIKKVGIYNPRLNRSYIYELSNISQNKMEYIAKNVIKIQNQEFITSTFINLFQSKV